MAKYYVPFVNINTFIYEPSGLLLNEFIQLSRASSLSTNQSDFLQSTKDDIVDQEKRTLPVAGESISFTFQNQLGGSRGHNGAATPVYRITRVEDLKNHDFSADLPNTASFFAALNLKRNGPYGYSSWKQIRSHENPLVRNQKKRNILTVIAEDGDISTYNQPNGPGTPYADPRTIEVFKEPVFSSREKNLVINFPQGNKIYRASLEMGSKIKYFDNDRLNEIYSPYDLSNPIETDSRFKAEFIEKTFLMIGRRKPVSIDYTHAIFPQKSSLEYTKRVRPNFYHPWKDDRQKRKLRFNLTYGLNTQAAEIKHFHYAGTTQQIFRSRWPLDSSIDFLTYNADRESVYSISKQDFGSTKYEGILQNTTKFLEDLQGKSRTSVQIQYFFALPKLSYDHTTTPLTSCVGPHGMDIEGVNEGTLFSDLSIDHIPSGDANWDAGSQYGMNPFYDSYDGFVDDIKKVGKEYAVIPEFRSSFHFNDLQNNQTRTSEGFLQIPGGKFLDTTNVIGLYQGKSNELGSTELGNVSSSSEDPGFYNIYSHSDFMKNFDIVSELANTNNKPLFKISLTCKAIKKFAPYEGFYPAERTVQIADKFRDSIIENCAYTGSGADNNVGDIDTTDNDRYIYFNNIMTSMFAPGIMYNSIKSGIAVDYPIHTSSLTIENGGIKVHNGNHYIREEFGERLPFESLIEPAQYLSAKELHCSEPHPSGNLSGSATWDGTGDTTEYQLMMHNFLAETANFFLQDQNFSFIASKRSDEVNIQLTSGSVYGFDISLYKSQNRASKKLTRSGVEFPSFFMSGSGVQETFTFYSRPSAFGPANRIVSVLTSNPVTSSYSDLGYNYAFTPPYYDGISKITFIYKAAETKNHSISEIFNGGIFLEQRASDLLDTGVLMANAPVVKFALNNIADIEEYLNIASMPTNHSSLKNCMTHAKASLNIDLGIIKDIDLLDDDTTDTVKVAVDISSERKSQIIIQPKYETPMFNFQSYSDSDTISLPLVGSQSVPRGIWHQYGAIETDPSKGVFMQITNVNKNSLFPELGISTPLDLAKQLGFDTKPVKLGKTASKKVVREAIIAVPFYDYTPNARRVSGRRKFLNIPRGIIDDALDGNGSENVLDMVNKMQRFVMPPMFNFIEDEQLDPITMYVFDFKHIFDQEDLAAIWQNLPPKLMTQFETEEKTISHSFEMDDLMSADALEQAGQGDMDKILKNLRWMVFKVKQKAEQNYYDKIVGETQKLNKTSPYSHNWPYDYFSLVELAKIDTKVQFATPPPPPEVTLEPLPVVTIPSLGPVVVPPAPTPAPRRSRKALVEKPVATPKTKKNKASSTPPKKKVVPPTRQSVVVAPKVGPKRETALQPISSPPRPERNERAKKQAGKDNLKKDQKQQERRKKDQKQQERDKKDQKTTNPDVSRGRKR